MAKQNRLVKIPKPAAPETFDTRVKLPLEARERLIALLNVRLADSLDLFCQCKFAHWNVKGLNFYQVHLLFDSIAEHVEEAIDLIGERITALGGVAEGTLQHAAAATVMAEYNVHARTSEEHLNALSDAVATFGNAVREGIDEATELGDQATAELLTEIVRQMDKDLYFLEAHLQA